MKRDSSFSLIIIHNGNKHTQSLFERISFIEFAVRAAWCAKAFASDSGHYHFDILNI